MKLNLIGKCALVGGASKGIGRASAIALAECGASVTILSRSEGLMEEVIQNLADNDGQKHDYIAVDYDQPTELRDHVARHINANAKSYDILINNSGGPPPGPVHKANIDELLTAFNRHLICNQELAKLLIPGMRASGYGRIINIISTSVKVPLHGLGVSNTIRGAVGNWAKTLANELGPDQITVNNVLPGTTATGRLSQIIEAKAAKSGKTQDEVTAAMQAETPMGRFADPAEIANAVAFLASPLASYITGTNVVVDGGRTGCL